MLSAGQAAGNILPHLPPFFPLKERGKGSHSFL